eukprot:766976-Hanusia_phi.AAC.5
MRQGGMGGRERRGRRRAIEGGGGGVSGGRRGRWWSGTPCKTSVSSCFLVAGGPSASSSLLGLLTRRERSHEDQTLCEHPSLPALPQLVCRLLVPTSRCCFEGKASVCCVRRAEEEAGARLQEVVS